MSRTKRRPAVGRPTYRREGDRPLKLAEVPPPGPLTARMINAENSYLRVYRLGDCSVIVTRERGRWHLSIAHPSRLPTWREVAEARYTLLPGDLVVAMILPPKASYVNLHENCFQMIEVRDPELPDL